MAENSKLTGIELNGVLYSLGKPVYEELDITLERFAELLGRDLYCPTLDSAPGSSTLNYTDTDGSTNTFQVGQPCRWVEGDAYRLAVCADITGTASEWLVLPVKVSELTNDAGYVSKTEMNAALTKKQDEISDLSTIRSNAAKGATALQSVPSEYVTETELTNKGYATSSSVNTAVSNLQTQLDTLVSGDASSAIESFNEITAFLDGVEDTETLEGILAGIETQIAAKADKSAAITSISRSGTTFTATRADGTTFTFSQQDNNTTYSFSSGTNGFTVTPSGGSAQTVSVTPSIANNVTYSGTLTSGQVAVLDGTAGKIKASGYTIASSVPSGAKFTDTTYSAATTSAAGLMSASDKSKLDGIASGATANAGTITGIKMNGASKGTSGVVDLGTVITAHQDISGKQDKGLKFNNVSASSWVGDSTYENYPYKCDLSCSGVTSSHFAEVVFDVEQAASGFYAPVCSTGTNIVTIWSSENTSITVPTIIITK